MRRGGPNQTRHFPAAYIIYLNLIFNAPQRGHTLRNDPKRGKRLDRTEGVGLLLQITKSVDQFISTGQNLAFFFLLFQSYRPLFLTTGGLET